MSQIPNGTFFSCNLCHTDGGGTARNPFGRDVEARLTPRGDADWAALFDLDSDGDGFSNGEEMADPDGDGTPIEGLDPSHPGIASSVPGPDLGVTLEAEADVAAGGGELSYQLELFNVGTRTAASASLLISLPEGAQLGAVDGLESDCTPDGETSFACEVGEVGPGFGVSVSFVVLFFEVSPGLVTIGVAASTEGDLDEANNSAEVETTVESEVAPVTFHRGDPNADGATDVSDALFIFGFLFLGDDAPGCREAGDVNNDGATDISDGVSVLAFLFTGGVAPAEPGPASEECGSDPDEPGSAGDLGCEEYPPCAG